jgi:thiol-disulfide isomerase/thioredoxin
MVAGMQEVLIDLENGALISRRVREQVEERALQYQVETTYQVRAMAYSTSSDSTLFALPAGLHEVKELPPWTLSAFRKKLTGKPAPELSVADIQSRPLALEAFKGKIVLLDFWTTWCPPCRADAPALDKLFRKYGDHDLMIIGVSVNEDKPVVEKYLKAHPHAFPTVLSSENEIPPPYQVSAFPTYVVIDRDGTVTAAVDGDQGFSELRKLLRKAGLEVE